MNEINLLSGLSGIGLTDDQLNAVMTTLAKAQAGSHTQNAIVNHLVPNLDPIMASAVAKGEYTNVGHEFYYNVIMTSLGQLDIVDTSVAESEGVTNLNFGRIPVDCHGVITRVELSMKTTGGVAIKTAAYAPIASTDDAALRNGSLEVKIAGKRIMKLPVDAFSHSPSIADQATLLQNGYNLKTPHPFIGGSTVEFNFKPAAGETIAANGCAIKIKMCVEYLVRKVTLK